MNILYICDEYPPGKIGGIGTAVQLLAREMVNLGHQVWVVGLYSSTFGSLDFEDDLGVQVYRLRYGLPFKHENIVSKAINKLPSVIKSQLNGKRAYKKFIQFIHQLIADKKINVIEMPDWHTFAMHIGFPIVWPKFNAPLILKAHGCYTKICIETNQKPKTVFYLNDKHLYERADAICAVSTDTANIVKNIFALKKEVKTMYNGINMPALLQTNNRNELNILYCGSLTEQKGVHQLMRAWNIVHKQRPDLKLLVYGKGKTDILKNILSSSAINSVSFGGHVSRDKLYELFKQVCLTVLPSYTETFGLVAIEAMANACPVIFTQRASGKEIIEHGVNGFLINPDNVDEIAQSILHLADDKTLRFKFSENGRINVEKKFDIKKVAVAHELYYHEVVNL